MSNKITHLPESFYIAIELVLEKNPQGIREYDLIRKLKQQGFFDFLSEPSMPDQLFRAHFILFHALYQLSGRYLKEKQYHLEIDALNIRLFPYAEANREITRLDKLSSYYMDLNNLENTSPDDVYELLASFWNKINKLDNRDQALAELGLRDPVDDKTVKQAYRKLAMQYHPDRGGDNEKLQKINDAIGLLLD